MQNYNIPILSSKMNNYKFEIFGKNIDFFWVKTSVYFFSLKSSFFKVLIEILYFLESNFHGDNLVIKAWDKTLQK